MATSVVDVSNTFGATLVGTFVTCMLYGLTVLQTYFYYTYYPKDPVQTKLLVAFIWFIDTLHIVFICFSSYYYLVSNYSRPSALAIGHWSLFVSVLLNTLIACIVQIYFVFRIYHLSQNKMRWWLTSIIGVAVVLHFGFGMETVTLMLIKKEFSKLTQINFYAATPFAIFAVLSDFMITGALIYLLHGHRTSFRKTNTLVSKLIIYAINRCLLTAIVEIAECIVFSTLTESLWFLAIDFVIGKLYANSLLATLNSRRMLTPRHKSTVGSVHLSRLDFRSSREGGSRPTIEISNRNMTQEMMDQDSGGIRMTEIIVVSKGGELENGVLTPPNTKEKE